MIIKSRGRRTFRIAFVLLLAIAFFILWLRNGDADYLIIAGAFGFVLLVEYAVHSQTTLQLTDDFLIVKQYSSLNLYNREYAIALKDIQSTFYDKKVYDAWELYIRLFWELFFPSGQSFLIVNMLNGERDKIPFNGNEKEILLLQQKLPQRDPNQ